MEQGMMPVEVRFKPSGKYWVASCPDLDIATQGESFEQAQENIKELLFLFVQSCLSRGTLEQVLAEAGYTKAQTRAVTKAARSFCEAAVAV